MRRSSAERIEHDITSLAKFGAKPQGGVSRLALDRADLEARNFVAQLMSEAGLQVRMDKACNIIGLRHGVQLGLPVVATGSHTDSVIDGGWFDGVVGVVGAIEAIRIMNEEEIKTKRSIEVIDFTGEEGSRYSGTLGSSIMTGVLPLKEALALLDKNGVSFKDAIMSSGYDQASLATVPRNRGEIDSFVEMHVEQGHILERAHSQVGIVEAIVGIARLWINVNGEAAHAGTTPMDERKDALLTSAKIIVKINESVRTIGSNCVGTVGWIEVHPGAFNVISGKAEFGVEIRSTSQSVLKDTIEAIKSSTAAICGLDGLTCEVKERFATAPTTMSERIISTIERSARSREAKYMRLPSRAGHDTMRMAHLADVGMIFVPSRRGISHSPKEWTDWEDISRGTDVLLETLVQLAQK